MGRLDSDAILELVGRIYDVAMSAEGWEPLLEQMTTLFEGTATVFFVRDSLAVDTVFFRYWGLSEAMLREAAERFSSIDIGLDSLLALPPGTVVTDEADPSRVDPRSEVLVDFLGRWDVGRYIGCDVFRDARRFGVVTVLGSGRRAPFGESEIDLMQSLIPHLRRAVELRSHIDQQDSDRSVVLQVIEGMLTGVVLLDAGGRVLMANAVARRLVQGGDGLLLARDRLRAASAADDELLQKAIAEALAISEHRDSEGSAAITVRRLSGGGAVCDRREPRCERRRRAIRVPHRVGGRLDR